MSSLKAMLSLIGGKIKTYIIVAICLLLGWFGKEIYLTITSSPISYRTGVDISYALDERGRLHIVDLKSEHTTIYTDSIALGIQAQVSSRIYQDYMRKTN